MSLAATFLGGAKSRLLPASIPFRFFAAAVGFHVLAWLGLLAAPEQAVGFRGGAGPALASLHALTIGVLVLTAIGASAQLLPVATRRPLAAIWPIRWVFWLSISGSIALIGSMFAGRTYLLAVAATLIAPGLLLYCSLLADNLRRARNLPVVAAYGWAALFAFLLVVALGILLAIDSELGILPVHGNVALAHLLLGGIGFMGLLALGFSHILIPMFALSAAPAARPSFVALSLAVLAVLVASAGAIIDSSLALTVGALIGFAAAIIHVRLMLDTLRSGMRKRLGLSFILVKAAWLMLVAVPLLGLAAIHGWAGNNGPTLFGFVLFAGWLLTFLLGVLQRIMPFLASMHASRSEGGTVPLMSDFSASRPLLFHAACHGIALAIIVIAIAVDNPWLMRAGAFVGLLGALAFAWFAAGVLLHVPWVQRPLMQPPRP